MLTMTLDNDTASKKTLSATALTPVGTTLTSSIAPQRTVWTTSTAARTPIGPACQRSWSATAGRTVEEMEGMKARRLAIVWTVRRMSLHAAMEGLGRASGISLSVTGSMIAPMVVMRKTVIRKRTEVAISVEINMTFSLLHLSLIKKALD